LRTTDSIQNPLKTEQAENSFEIAQAKMKKITQIVLITTLDHRVGMTTNDESSGSEDEQSSEDGAKVYTDISSPSPDPVKGPSRPVKIARQIQQSNWWPTYHKQWVAPEAMEILICRGVGTKMTLII
jgi:hypothetical protein